MHLINLFKSISIILFGIAFSSCNNTEGYVISSVDSRLISVNEPDSSRVNFQQEVLLGVGFTFNLVGIDSNSFRSDSTLYSLNHEDTLNRIDIFLKIENQQFWITPYLDYDTVMAEFFGNKLKEKEESQFHITNLDQFIELYNANDIALNKSILKGQEFIFWMDARHLEPQLRDKSDVSLDFVFTDRTIHSKGRRVTYSMVEL